MKHSRRILAILYLPVWSFATLLWLDAARGKPPDMVAIAGAVLDSDSMTPLPGTKVTWRSRTATSDKAGRYEIELPVGVREITFSAPDRPAVVKMLVIRKPGSRVRQDVVLPKSPGPPRYVLALDRGSRVGQHGKDLDSDVSADSTISIADEFGNHDRLLNLDIGRNRVHSPVWLNATTIAFGKEGIIHSPENSRLLGVFQYQRDSGRIRQIASATGIHSLSKAPGQDALAVASQKDLYVMDSLSNPSSLRRLLGLGANRGFLLSVAWAQDDRIYFTIDDSIQLDDRHYLSKSRIASIRADGTDLQSDWAQDPQHSYRYPMNAEGAEIIFCRFALDGTHQALWSRNIHTGRERPIAEPALRAVHMDSRTSRLYYVYDQDLHLRDSKTGADWLIVNSVMQADYLRSLPLP